MKPFDLRLCSALAAVALAGSAQSHNISGDDWLSEPGIPAGGNGTSVAVNQAGLPGNMSGNITLAGITSLSFSPGTVNPGYELLSQLPNCPQPPQSAGAICFAGDRYAWSGGGGEETVDLIAGYSTAPASVSPLPTAAALTSTQFNGPFNELPVLTVLFGYGDGNPNDTTDCTKYSGQTASLTVNNVTYKAANPCSLQGGDPSVPTAGPGDLTFINGVLQAGTGVGWTESTAVAAPEVDLGSAASGLTLMLGGILVLRGRTTGASTRYSVARERLEV
jgi:hypothetical protein